MFVYLFVCFFRSKGNIPMIPLGLKETKEIDFREPFKVSSGAFRSSCAAFSLVIIMTVDVCSFVSMMYDVRACFAACVFICVYVISHTFSLLLPISPVSLFLPSPSSPFLPSLPLSRTQDFINFVTLPKYVLSSRRISY